jgi:uncharacterized iron-regulated membrane protein
MPMTSTRARQLWLGVHLYIALSLGLLLALIGLSGSLSIVGGGLDRLFNPGLVIEPGEGTPRTLDELMAAVRRAHPDRKGSWTLELPRSPEQPLIAWYEKPVETIGERYAPLMVAVNPYMGEVLASRYWGSTLRTWLVDLHTQLHLGGFGWQAVGVCGIALFVSLLSGLYLWWPGVRRLPQSVRLRCGASLKVLMFDLHRLLGVVGCAALLVLAVTGISLSWPDLSESLLGAKGMGHGDDGPDIRSTAESSSTRPVSLEEAVLLARGPFKRAAVRQIATPSGPGGTYRVTFRQYFEVNDRHPMTQVWIDQYSGQIREVRNPARFTVAQTALTWLWPVHTGEALGGWGQVGWFLAGLILPLLYVTGLTRWLIGRGAIRDAAVDFSVLQAALLRRAALTKGWLQRRWQMTRPWLSGWGQQAAALSIQVKNSLLKWWQARQGGR